jgi:aryl-alcohol dehydrogenase-like predicted oxidoreductase
MEVRELGKNGPLVSAIGFGAWPIGSGMGWVDEKTAIDTVRAAIDQGIKLIDTAQYYRTSESLIGKALKDGYRQRCFLATKDYVDLYQIHSWNPEYPIDESMETLIDLQQQGKTRYIGVSNFNKKQMQKAWETSPFQSNQPVYNMIDRDIEAADLPFCVERGIGILAHSTLAKGLLTGKYHPDHRFPSDDERSEFPRFQGDGFIGYIRLAERLGEVAHEKKISLLQLAIAWSLRLPAITSVLVGAKNPSQITDYLGAIMVRLCEEDLLYIDEILKDRPLRRGCCLIDYLSPTFHFETSPRYSTMIY